MQSIHSRRAFLSTAVCASLVLATGVAAPSSRREAAFRTQIADLEARSGGRLGVCALAIASGHRAGHREDERFAMCSTFKFLLAAQALSLAEQGVVQLDHRIIFDASDLVPYSPATEKHTGKNGMSIAKLCAAAMTLSDNTAANLLLSEFGGPAALTAWVRSLGDAQTRLDRIEPELNEALPGDPRDTTTPAAMLEDMRVLLLGNALTAASRDQLGAWLLANTTGADRLRAGLPAAWRVGDKTGTSGKGMFNDIGIARPPAGGALLVTAYFDSPGMATAQANAVIAEVGRLAARLVR